MSDPKETVYPADAHTRAKHLLLKAYLKAWLAILSNNAQRINRKNQRLLYVDGFAGAGEYENNVPGSPIVFIDTVIEHRQSFACPIEIRLIEKRRDRVEHLTRLIARRRESLTGDDRVTIIDPVEGDCETEVRKLIAASDQGGRALGPAFFFLDQFGYSSFSMDLIANILRHEMCEVFSYLNWGRLHPFMTDATKHSGIDEAFGGSEWRDVIELHGQQKESRFREIYLHALRTRGNARYAYPFAMRDANNRIIYWLFFCTNSIKGLEEMKRAMCSVDPSGGFQFSDKFAEQRDALFPYTPAELIGDIIKDQAGRVLTVRDLREFVLVDTPAHKYFEVFGQMEHEGSLVPVRPPKGRRSRSFSNFLDMEVAIRHPATASPPSLFGGLSD